MSFLDNKKSLIFWSIFSLILSAVLLVLSVGFGIEASYSASKTIFNSVSAYVFLVLSILSFLFFVFISVKAFLKSGKAGIWIALVLGIIILGFYLLFLR